jgi:hypothetical protein
MIEEGKNKLSWWGTVEPILIGQSASSTPLASSAATDFASMQAGTSSSSAEVSVSRGAETVGTNRTTSLQF